MPRLDHDRELPGFARAEQHRLLRAWTEPSAVTGRRNGHRHAELTAGQVEAGAFAWSQFRHCLLIDIQLYVAGVWRIVVATEYQPPRRTGGRIGWHDLYASRQGIGGVGQAAGQAEGDE